VDLYEEIVDTMGLLSGVHPGHRAAHAKGVFCSGTFTPSEAAAGLSRAAHFQQAVPVTARFSNGGGDPGAPDAQRLEGRGLAVKFHLPDGGATDIVALTLPVFFVRTPEDFLDFLKARVPDPGSEGPNMERVSAFLAEHPETGAALQLILPALVPPVSYATCAYNSLHAFGLVNDGGERRYVRYRLVPEAGEALLPEDEIEAAAPDYLQEELAERLTNGPIAFTLLARLADANANANGGDPIDDPTLPWPEEREAVELGRLQLDALTPGAESNGEIVVFDPTNVVDGIELSDDAILHARSRAYSVSAARRAAATQT
jgi:catalase